MEYSAHYKILTCTCYQEYRDAISFKHQHIYSYNYASLGQGDADIIIAVILPEHLPKPIFLIAVGEVADILSMHAFDRGLAGTDMRDSLQGTAVGHFLIEDSFILQVSF